MNYPLLDLTGLKVLVHSYTIDIDVEGIISNTLEMLEPERFVSVPEDNSGQQSHDGPTRHALFLSNRL